MTRRRKGPFYKDLTILALLGGGLLGLGAVGAAIVAGARYITLPERVDKLERQYWALVRKTGAWPDVEANAASKR